jgi:hypothetical protein
MFKHTTGIAIAELLQRNGVPLIEADNTREAGWVNMHTWLVETVRDLEANENDEVEARPRPRLQVLRPILGTGLGCPALIRAIPSAVVNQKKPHDLVGPFEDPLDTTRYFCQSRVAASRKPRHNSARDAEIRRLLAANKRRAVLGTESVRNRRRRTYA